MPTKGDFYESVSTQEANVTIGLSFSDQIEKGPVHAEPPLAECCILQLSNGVEVDSVVYLGIKQVEALIHVLQDVRNMWYRPM